MHNSTEKKSGPRHIRRHKPIRALVVLLAAGAVATIGAAAGIIGAYYFVQPGLPAAETIRDIPLQIPLRIYSRDGFLISEIGERRRVLVTWDELPAHVVDAFVAAEDQRFFLHPGVDYRGLTPLDYLADYGQRALYVIVAEDDEYSFQSSEAIRDAAVESDPFSLRVFDGADHGTNLLRAHPGLDMTIISGWLLNHLPPVR